MESSVSLERKLIWVHNLFTGWEPKWGTQPSLSIIESIVRQQLSIPQSVECTVSLFAEGAFNKIYAISSPALPNSPEYLLRVALPIEPMYKTLSEVATVSFLRRQEWKRYVPKVFAFSSDTDTEFGFEWILMQRMSGVAAADAWGDMTWTDKENVVQTLVSLQASLFRNRFQTIGNLYLSEHKKDEFEIGRMVSMIFFWHSHSKQDVPRRPFTSSYDWLAARVAFILNDSEEVVRSSKDEDDIEDAERVKQFVLRLQRVLASHFPSTSRQEPELTALCHDDLNWHNVLIHNSRLSAIIDWECVSVLPLWKVCQFPSFLVGKQRLIAPDPETYGAPLQENEIYKEHLREYEQTKLRKVFLQEMEMLEPQWVELHTDPDAERKADFDYAVELCGGGRVSYARPMNAWLDQIERGEKNIISLRKRCWQWPENTRISCRSVNVVSRCI